MDKPQEYFGRKAISGSMMIGGAQVVKIIVQFISVVVLARLLLPEDFGLVAAVSPLIVFLGMFQDFGFQQAVVQRKEIHHTQLNQIFWLTVAIGVVCAVILGVISPFVAAFYGDPRITFITIAVAGPLILNSILSLPLGLLNREMKFGTIAGIDTVAAIIGLVVAIIAAMNGLGYWSLILSPAASAAVTLVGAWVFSGWKPGAPAFRVEREIISFGANLTGFNFVNFFARNLDNVLIGRFIGADGLGFYDRAYKLMLFPLQNISGPLSRIMVPILSRVQEDAPRFRRIYMRALGAMVLFTIPGVGALVITAEETIRFLFGERWMAVVPIFMWLGLAGIAQAMTNSLGWVFISLGKTDVMFKFGIFASITTIISFVVGLQWGVAGLAMAYAINEVFVRMPMAIVVLGRTTPIKAWQLVQIQVPLMVSVGAAWFFMSDVKVRFEMPDLMLIAVSIAASYVLALLAFLSSGHGRRIAAEIFDAGRGYIR